MKSKRQRTKNIEGRQQNVHKMIDWKFLFIENDVFKI